MWKKNDLVVLKYDDSPDNQEIIGKILKVIEPPRSLTAPLWMEVVTEEGCKHSVRGADCRAASFEPLPDPTLRVGELIALLLVLPQDLPVYKCISNTSFPVSSAPIIREENRTYFGKFVEKRVEI